MPRRTPPDICIHKTGTGRKAWARRHASFRSAMPPGGRQVKNSRFQHQREKNVCALKELYYLRVSPYK